jgi:hypothetical protein
MFSPALAFAARHADAEAIMAGVVAAVRSSHPKAAYADPEREYFPMDYRAALDAIIALRQPALARYREALLTAVRDARQRLIDEVGDDAEADAEAVR